MTFGPLSCDEIFIEKASGKLGRRPELDELLPKPSRAAGHEVVKQLYLDSRQLAEWDELLVAVAETTNARPSASHPRLQIVRHRADSGPPAEIPGGNEGQNADLLT